jgi:hypothetical protein
LEQLAAVMLTDWGARKPEEADLAATVWELDFQRIRLEVVERLQEEEQGVGGGGGDGPGIARIAAMIEELEAEATAAAESGMMRQDEVEVLLRLKDQVGDEKLKLAQLRIDSELSPRLREDLAALRAGTDLEKSDIPSLLGLGMHKVDTPLRVDLLARALVDWLSRGIAAGQTSTLGIHRLLELLDPECSPHLTWRSSVMAAMSEFGEPEMLEIISRSIPGQEDARWKGLLFGLGQAVMAEATLRSLATALPVWATRVLADAVVLREQLDQQDLYASVHGRLLEGEMGALRLGLAMAARLDDARLGDSLLNLTSHSDGSVREAALFALRRYPSPRLRTRVQELVDDPVEGVRLEVLRHAVASRDTQIGRKLEGRLCSESLSRASEAEVRALCIAMGRILKSEADGPLLAIALGQKHSFNSHASHMALYGLKASGSRNARLGLQRIVTESPRMATEAEGILREMGG